MTNRRKLEKEITEKIRVKVSLLGFNLKDKSLNFFEYIKDSVKWEFWFYLTGSKPYSLFLKVGITYLELNAVINRLLVETNDDINNKLEIGMATNDFKIIKNVPDLKISNIDTLEDFTDYLYCRIKEIEDKFWIPQSTPFEQIESFIEKMPGHWLNPILIQNVMICVATGILNKNSELIRKCLEKGMSSLSEKSQSYEEDKLLIQTLTQKVNQKGYI